MSFFLQLAYFLRSLVDQGGYPMIFLAMVVEGVITPIPSATILPFAGLLAREGSLLLPLVILVAAAGATVGSLGAYAIGWKLGRPFLLRYGKWFRIEDRHLDLAEDWFDRWGNWAIFVGNSLTGFRSFISFPAGIGKMPLRGFVPFTFAGSLVWSAILVTAGFYLGAAAFDFANALESFDLVVLGAVGAALLWFYLLRRWRNRKGLKPAQAP